MSTRYMTEIPSAPLSEIGKTNPATTGSVNKSAKNSSPGSQNLFASPYISVFVTLGLLFFLFGVSFFIAYAATKIPASPTNYEECIKSKGSYIREGYPATCVSKKGSEFIQPLSPDEQKLLESKQE